MWLWELRSPQICSQEAGDSGQPMAYFQVKGLWAQDSGEARVVVEAQK